MAEWWENLSYYLPEQLGKRAGRKLFGDIQSFPWPETLSGYLPEQMGKKVGRYLFEDIQSGPTTYEEGANYILKNLQSGGAFLPGGSMAGVLKSKMLRSALTEVAPPLRSPVAKVAPELKTLPSVLPKPGEAIPVLKLKDGSTIYGKRGQQHFEIADTQNIPYEDVSERGFLSSQGYSNPGSLTGMQGPVGKAVKGEQPWEMTSDAYFKQGEPKVEARMSTSELVKFGGTNREERYVRSNARYRDMVDRMKKYGYEGNIIEPPKVVLRRNVDGSLNIEDGNHRVIAAFDAGIKDIPVEIIEKPFHKDVVKQALSEGKPVPPEVLRDYPELKTVPSAPKPSPSGSLLDFKSLKQGDFVTFIDEFGNTQTGKLREYADMYGKTIEVFPQDQSLIKIKERGSITVPLNKLLKVDPR